MKKAAPRQASPPSVHICAVCGRPGAPCGVGSSWYCYRTCKPADWAPARRAAGAAETSKPESVPHAAY